MATQVIPTLIDGTAFYTQTSTLDGIVYQLIFSYNARDEHWFLTLRTEDGDEIVGCEGMKLVQGGFPLRRVYDENRPPGELYVQSDLKNEPGLTTLGTDTFLLYIPEADFEETFV